MPDISRSRTTQLVSLVLLFAGLTLVSIPHAAAALQAGVATLRARRTAFGERQGWLRVLSALSRSWHMVLGSE